MTNRLPETIAFDGTDLRIIDHKDRVWMTAEDIGRALGYSSDRKRGAQTEPPFDERPISRGIRTVYDRHADEFAEDETAIITVDTAGGIQQVRVFSPRGARLLAIVDRRGGWTPIGVGKY